RARPRSACRVGGDPRLPDLDRGNPLYPVVQEPHRQPDLSGDRRLWPPAQIRGLAGDLLPPCARRRQRRDRPGGRAGRLGAAGAVPDGARAAKRYGEAYRRVGIAAPAYVYEPVGAAFYYAQRLKTDALVLVADFGGGTSDFSLIRFIRQGDTVTATPLGHAGL